jgi:intein/homing endonuclease
LIYSVEPINREADVYHVTLSTGHVYVAGNLAAHNMVKLPDM